MTINASTADYLPQRAVEELAEMERHRLSNTIMLIVLTSAPHRPQTPFLDPHDKETPTTAAQTYQQHTAAYWE